MRKPDREYWLNNEHYVEEVTSQAVGFPVKVYTAQDDTTTGMGNTVAYQIMPATNETASEFFFWHLENNRQWFESPPEAAAAFVRAWRAYGKQAASAG